MPNQAEGPGGPSQELLSQLGAARSQVAELEREVAAAHHADCEWVLQQARRLLKAKRPTLASLTAMQARLRWSDRWKLGGRDDAELGSDREALEEQITERIAYVRQRNEVRDLNHVLVRARRAKQPDPASLRVALTRVAIKLSKLTEDVEKRIATELEMPRLQELIDELKRLVNGRAAELEPMAADGDEAALREYYKLVYSGALAVNVFLMDLDPRLIPKAHPDTMLWMVGHSLPREPGEFVGEPWDGLLKNGNSILRNEQLRQLAANAIEMANQELGRRYATLVLQFATGLVRERYEGAQTVPRILGDCYDDIIRLAGRGEVNFFRTRP